ncbi:MAG: aldose epimerase family protein [Kordiimonas sp.]
MTVHAAKFDHLDGKVVKQYTLSNRYGMEVDVLNFGAIIRSIRVPHEGKRLDVVLGCDSIADYCASGAYLGAVVGPYANRIAKGCFELDGKTFQLDCNENSNHLHGGKKGLDKQFWLATEIGLESEASILFHYQKAHLEGGYPGIVDYWVRYTLTDDNEIRVAFNALTDRSTIVNLTQHSYFNLAGSGSCLGHELKLVSDCYAPVSEQMLPDGNLVSVQDTAFDFRNYKPIGRDIRADDPQLHLVRGYDHSFPLDGGGPSPCAFVRSPETGIAMEILTTQPSVHLYTGNFLDNVPAKGGGVYGRYAGFCLETQHFPNSPNIPSFPSTVLRADEKYMQETVYKFTC